jgi:HK97 family phage major capsid protein
LRPAQISGFDLSTISGALVGETVQQNPQTVPSAAGAVLRNNLIFKATFSASNEGEQDFENFTQKIVAASSTALARVISKKVIAGAGGSSDIPGVALALSSTLSNGTGGKLVLADFVNCVYSVDQYWKGSPKCAWLIPSAVAKFARLAVDGQGRPLLDISTSDGHLSILGFPAYISPSLATAVCGIGAVGGVLFGDLGTGMVVRTSRPQIQRSVEAAQGGIETGQALFTARCRADAVAWDPSAGANPSVILMTIN